MSKATRKAVIRRISDYIGRPSFRKPSRDTKHECIWAVARTQGDRIRYRSCCGRMEPWRKMTESEMAEHGKVVPINDKVASLMRHPSGKAIQTEDSVGKKKDKKLPKKGKPNLKVVKPDISSATDSVNKALTTIGEPSAAVKSLLLAARDKSLSDAALDAKKIAAEANVRVENDGPLVVAGDFENEWPGDWDNEPSIPKEDLAGILDDGYAEQCFLAIGTGSEFEILPRDEAHAKLKEAREKDPNVPHMIGDAVQDHLGWAVPADAFETWFSSQLPERDDHHAIAVQEDFEPDDKTDYTFRKTALLNAGYKFVVHVPAIDDEGACAYGKTKLAVLGNLSNDYRRNQLVYACSQRGIPFKAKDNKETLAKLLVETPDQPEPVPGKFRIIVADEDGNSTIMVEAPTVEALREKLESMTRDNLHSWAKVMFIPGSVKSKTRKGDLIERFMAQVKKRED